MKIHGVGMLCNCAAHMRAVVAVSCLEAGEEEC